MARKKRKTIASPRKKESEVTTEKESSKKAELTPVQKQKLKGGILIVIGLGTLIFVGYFLFGKLFRPQPLAELLAAERTVGLLEVNIDGNSGQVNQFYKLMENYPVYQREGIISLVNTTFPISYTNDLEPWLGRQVGLALLSYENDGPFSYLFFVESRDHNLTLEFLKSKGLEPAVDELQTEDYEGFRIYDFTISQRMSFAFVNNYLVAADSKEMMKQFIDDFVSLPRLSDDPDYRKVANNLPQGGLIFAYGNVQKLFSALQKDELFVAQKGQDLLALRPFLNIFRAEGLTVIAESGRITAQTFTSINTEGLEGESYITFSEPYQGFLLQLVNEDPVLLVGGHDITKELSRIEEIFKSGTKTPALVFEGLLEAQKQRYFGKDIGLKEDIYPLFTGEYLAVIENSLEKPVVSLLLELNDNTGSVSRFDRVVNAFIDVSGVFSPRVQEVTLPDGTVGREIVASPEKIEQSTSTHNGNTITSLRLGETGIALHYAILDNIMLLSTEDSTLKQMMDRHEGTLEGGLTGSQYYERNLRPVLRTADQVLHVKLGAVMSLMGVSEEDVLAAYLLPFNNFTITKNFFRDGISTIYLVEVI